MAFSRLFILLIVSVSCYATQVPVFFWGDLPKTSQAANPLETVTGEEFRSVLKQEFQGSSLLVVFMEESLSVEDFSHRNADGKTSFPYLKQQLGKSLYLPSVENAVHQLEKLSTIYNTKHVKLADFPTPSEIAKSDIKVLFVNLKDVKEGENRSEMLLRHNREMEKLMAKLQGSVDNVIACYTAYNPSWIIPETHSRTRRQADATPGDYMFDGLRLYTTRFWLSNEGVVSDLGVPTATSQFNGTVMNTLLNFNTATMTLNFHVQSGYWFFDTVTLHTVNSTQVNESLRGTSEVFALTDFSYRCKQNVSYTSATLNETKLYAVKFEDFKIQPFFETTNGTVKEFGDSFNCVGFFTAPIWAGLFVVFILLAITFYGIMMMMDIRTMDRFDDPKGKTITINAGE